MTYRFDDPAWSAAKADRLEREARARGEPASDMFDLRRWSYGPEGDEERTRITGSLGRFASSGECLDAVVREVSQLDGPVAQMLVDWTGLARVEVVWGGRSGLVLTAVDNDGNGVLYRARLTV